MCACEMEELRDNKTSTISSLTCVTLVGLVVALSGSQTCLALVEPIGAHLLTAADNETSKSRKREARRKSGHQSFALQLRVQST